MIGRGRGVDQAGRSGILHPSSVLPLFSVPSRLEPSGVLIRCKRRNHGRLIEVKAVALFVFGSISGCRAINAAVRIERELDLDDLGQRLNKAGMRIRNMPSNIGRFQLRRIAAVRHSSGHRRGPWR